MAWRAVMPDDTQKQMRGSCFGCSYLEPTLKMRYRMGQSLPAKGRLVRMDFWMRRCARSSAAAHSVTPANATRAIAAKTLVCSKRGRG
eukprot:300839-Rhodomonas_salina.6